MLDKKLKTLLDNLTTSELLKVVSYVQGQLEERANPDSAELSEDSGGLFRRQHRRFTCKFRATFLRHNPPEEQQHATTKVCEATVVDISQGGMMLHTNVPLQPGEFLTVFLKSEAWVEKKVFFEVRRSVDHWEYFEVGGRFVEQSVVIAAERARLIGRAAPSGQPDQEG